jgi:enoyl-CoA hydratase
MTALSFEPTSEREFAGMTLARREGQLRVTFDRPAQLNAPDRPMHRALFDLWQWVDESEWIRGVLVTGSGRAFSAGADRALLAAMLDDSALCAEVIVEAGQMLLALARVHVPVVAAVNGAAVGLACSILSLCDHVLMSEGAFLVDPHVDVGLVCGDGVAITWPLLVALPRARDAALLGWRVGADDAVAAGLANQVVAAEALGDVAARVCQRLASLPPQAFAETKRVLHQPMIDRLSRTLPLARTAEMESFADPVARARLAVALER